MSGNPPTATDVLRCYLRGLVFRFNHVTDRAPAGFGDFDPGGGVRPPIEIVRHMTGLLLFAHDQFEEKERDSLHPLPWQEETTRFVDTAWDLYRLARSGSQLRPGRRVASLEQVWVGPLADLMTHVGQLATLRRLAGSPVEPVRYWQVDCPEPPTTDR